MHNSYPKPTAQNLQPTKVYVALSGGVDSSVTAALLQEQGYDVTGVFIRVWQADFLPCTQDDEERDAKRVAAFLGIPFKVLDLSDEYKKDIVDPMIRAYKKGETPNPDVLCNRYIKFGPFRTWAQSERAEYIATGHHAAVKKQNGEFRLLRGADPQKDQAYFLWMLTQEDLKMSLMPVGEMTKDQVRAYAKEKSLPTAKKKDSQGLCFLGDVQMKAFLQHFIETKPGIVLNEKGEEVGTHEGAVLYTLGQRSGFSIHTRNEDMSHYYVVSKDMLKNTITVAQGESAMSENKTSKEIRLHLTNWISEETNESEEYQCEIRYHGEAHVCTIKLGKEALATVHLKAPIPPVAKGQSVVIYKNDWCIGGGIVLK